MLSKLLYCVIIIIWQQTEQHIWISHTTCWVTLLLQLLYWNIAKRDSCAHWGGATSVTSHQTLWLVTDIFFLFHTVITYKRKDTGNLWAEDGMNSDAGSEMKWDVSHWDASDLFKIQNTVVKKTCWSRSIKEKSSVCPGHMSQRLVPPI
jgi:hypothetical protein